MRKKFILLLSCIAILIIIVLFCNRIIKRKKINEIIEVKHSCYNPVIPNGFKRIDTENANWQKKDNKITDWDKGLVIEDENGNQFVWVPVKNVEEYMENKYTKQLLDSPTEKEIEQIEKYGGFYIARYEAGLPIYIGKTNLSKNTNDIEGKPISKPGAIAWNYITLKNAKKSAKLMYNYENLESDLITTRQYLYILKWFKASDYNIDELRKIWEFCKQCILI